MSRVQEEQRQEPTRCDVVPMIRTRHRWISTHYNSKVTRSSTRVEDLDISRRTVGKTRARARKGSQGQRWQEGKGKCNGKTNNDVCLKCGQRGHWAKICPNPAEAIHRLDGQNDANNSGWQWYDGQEWKAPSDQITDETQYVAPTQPMAEPEANGRIVAGKFDGWSGK